MQVTHFLLLHTSCPPSGNTASPTLQLTETSSAIVAASTPITPVAIAGQTTGLGQVVYIAGSADAAAVSAKFKVYMQNPSKAGTYVVKLVPAVTSGGGVVDTTGVTLTITVSQNPATDTVVTSATSIITTAADNNNSNRCNSYRN